MLSSQVIVAILMLLVGSESARNYPLYKQKDDKWGNDTMGVPQDTISNRGCLISSAAMALSGIGVDYDPGTLNNYLKENGGYDSNGYFIWGSINGLGLKFMGFKNKASIESNLAKGNVVIFKIYNKIHWVLATSMLSEDNVAVNDSIYGKISYKFDNIDSGLVGVYSVGYNFFEVMLKYQFM